jgi:2-keto-4-pentenoate hydratase/2-oxohepta-3-ene-1,7-dioic acid hydratase in catechol pathway
MSEPNERMLLLRYGPPGNERPAVRVGTTDYDLTALTTDIDGAFLDDDGIARVRRALVRGELSEVVTTGERLGPPVARPAAVICVGQNYAAHAAEAGAAPPDLPVVFLKHPGCVVGPSDPVKIPRDSTHTDWEVELAVVLKRTPRYLDDAEDPLEGTVALSDQREARQ